MLNPNLIIHNKTEWHPKIRKQKWKALMSTKQVTNRGTYMMQEKEIMYQYGTKFL